MANFLSLLFLMTIVGMVFSSCSDDENCEDLETVIVGEWSVLGQGTVEFMSDGVLFDPDCLVFEVRDLDVKEWSVQDSRLQVGVTKEDQSDSSSISFEVVDFTCSQMTLSVPLFGNTVVLNKV